MNTRKPRLKAIKKIIQQHRVTSQENLLHLLEEEENMIITQATLSRDLKMLQVGKVPDGADSYYYTLPQNQTSPDEEKNFQSDLIRGFLSMGFSHNLAIIKTLPGHANSVALAIDQLDLDEVAGTLAGDDTIFLALNEQSTRNEFIKQMRILIPNLEDQK